MTLLLLLQKLLVAMSQLENVTSHNNEKGRGRFPIPRSWVDAEVTSNYKGKRVRTVPASSRNMFLLGTVGKYLTSLIGKGLIYINVNEVYILKMDGMSTEQVIFAVKTVI